MLNVDVGDVVDHEIRELLAEVDDEVGEFSRQANIHDIGMDSMSIARLLIRLEQVLGIDPFRSEQAHISDVRTVEDLVAVYRSGLAGAPDPVGAPEASGSPVR